jgi:hypothetical protein
LLGGRVSGYLGFKMQIVLHLAARQTSINVDMPQA